MNAYARNPAPSAPCLVDDADASRDPVEPEQDLASLPTLPRFPAQGARPSNATAANAPEMTSAPAVLELSLEPIDERRPATASVAYVAPSPIASVPPGVTSIGVPTPTPAGAAERCLVEATLELDAGQVDQPLWMRAVTQANGDEAAVRTAYLKARATALRMARREPQKDGAERGVRVLGQLHPERRTAVAGRGLAGLFTRNRIIAAAGVGALLLAGAWLQPGDPAPSPAAAVAVPQTGTSTAAPSVPVTATVADAPANAPESERTQAQALAARVAELSAAGNWNVLVLHATEWTRRDPNNADAWLALGAGFSRLKQHADAAEALTRATTLAPERPDAWRGLGEAKAAWGATDEAIAAYERAVAMDDRDIASLVEVGLLQAGKGDHARAKDTLDRALALNAADVEALCAAATVAHKSGRAKDAQGHARQAESLGAACPEAAPQPPSTPVRVVGAKPSTTPAIARR
jgi:tetratricopeptide (TPR) repeat protein